MVTAAEFHLPTHRDVLTQQRDTMWGGNPVATAGHRNGGQAQMRKLRTWVWPEMALSNGNIPSVRFPGFTQIFAFFMWKTQSSQEIRVF